jgi:Zn-dependent M28 family amino/carboxypeptidase
VKDKLARSILFIAFSGEEEGLLGSAYYVKNSLIPLENTITMINMDMIGRLKERKLIVNGAGLQKFLENY